MGNKNKNYDQKPVIKTLELLYMTPSEIRAKDIADLLQDAKGITAELWEEMNVLELELSNQNSVDFEPLDTHFSNPSDAAFIKNRGIMTIFAVCVKEEDFQELKAIFEVIVLQYNGFLCSDTEDFQPVHVGSATK
ncbi:MAG: hypothetical protein K0R46_2191 [Herbinix sp.]|jgi:hypothetical protein|nr:hypothetical protein [Herbinix sp.]